MFLSAFPFPLPFFPSTARKLITIYHAVCLPWIQHWRESEGENIDRRRHLFPFALSIFPLSSCAMSVMMHAVGWQYVRSCVSNRRFLRNIDGREKEAHKNIYLLLQQGYIRGIMMFLFPLGPATVRMISENGPAFPLPLHLPPGHMVQQVLDENGVLTHVIMSQAGPPPPPPPPPPHHHVVSDAMKNEEKVPRIH